MKIFLTWHLWFLWSQFIETYNQKYEIIWYDIIQWDDLWDYQKLKEKMKGCDIVIHLAAIPKPIPEKDFSEYMEINVHWTENVFKASQENSIKKVIYASSTTTYGIEKGIPFEVPLVEDVRFLSQYVHANQLKSRDCDMSYHISKVMAEQICAWYGLTKKFEVIVLRFAPIDKVFLGTSISLENACHIIDRAIETKNKFEYEVFNAVDSWLAHISCEKAQKYLWYTPKNPKYSSEQIHSSFQDIQKYL